MLYELASTRVTTVNCRSFNSVCSSIPENITESPTNIPCDVELMSAGSTLSVVATATLVIVVPLVFRSVVMAVDVALATVMCFPLIWSIPPHPEIAITSPAWNSFATVMTAGFATVIAVIPVASVARGVTTPATVPQEGSRY